MGNEPLEGGKTPASASPRDPCPRCGTENDGQQACARCGLAREHREKFATDTALPAGLAEHWDAVLAAWDDPAPHAIFIESCAQAQALDLAAARYRALRADPARAERCARSLDRIVALAEAGLAKTSSGAEKVVRNRRIIFALALVVMLAFLSFVAWAVLSR
ncbi:MAG: hypothetical protein HY907_11575 [Deltaproteobacteria bacterium]|nr:hypothetical protein [Deltaproteobacteria bacterium]